MMMIYITLFIYLSDLEVKVEDLLAHLLGCKSILTFFTYLSDLEVMVEDLLTHPWGCLSTLLF